MKFEQNVLTKKAMYRGVEVECLAHHYWIAIDSDGKVYSYEEKPVFVKRLGCWKLGDFVSLRYMHIGFSDEISEEESLNSLQEL